MLKYVGNKDGHGWALPNVPAKDLSDEDTERLAQTLLPEPMSKQLLEQLLIDTGHYEAVGAQDTQYPAGDAPQIIISSGG